MTDLFSRTKSIVTEAGEKIAPAEFIRSSVREMDRDDLEALASAYLLAQVKMRKRQETLSVERGAERVPVQPPVAVEREPNWGTQKWDVWAARPENHGQAQKTRDWHAEGDRLRDELFAKKLDMMAEIMKQYKNELRMEWTRELLDSEFALGDGTTVRWGDATREHHLYRYQLHERNAIAGIEGAARHKQALDALDATGAATLREAVLERV